MKQTIKELKYSLYLIRHPFKGFWDIKYEKEGSLKTAIILLVSAAIVNILRMVYTGYLFGGKRDVYYNMFDSIVSFFLLYFLFTISNWCLTCLSDGKGTFKDICIATAYALVPYILIQLLLILLGNVFVIREEVFFNMLNNLSFVWVGFLVVTGMLVTHHFTLTRTVVVILFTLVGIAAIGFLILLFFNLIQQVLGFITIVIDEIIMRLSY